MNGKPERTVPVTDADGEEQEGLSRAIAQIHWLLLFVVLAYLLLGGVRNDGEASAAISSGLFFYAALVVGFRYANVYRRETHWKIGIETVSMIALITWALRYTGGIESPLAGTYLLPVVTSALALGRLTTLAELILIAVCQAILGAGSVAKFLSLPFLGGFIAQVAPIALVAYVTMLFSSDIRHGLNRARLLSQTDELTGLYNRRGFLQLTGRFFGQAARFGKPAAVLMIDSDNLKGVNDTHGHEAGNLFLKLLADTLVAQLRSTDIAGRYGGDEFILLLRDTAPQGAIEVAERMRRAVAGKSLEFAGTRIQPSVSIGVACFPQDADNLSALIEFADRGLYQAKQQGRGRTVRLQT